MARKKTITGFAGNNHPALEELLLCADRELEESEVARIEAHLAACWACRAKTGKIEETISSLVEYEETILKPNFPPPPHNWRGFDGRLRQLLAAAEVAARVALHRLGADLGEPIEVAQQPDRIDARGLAETVERKQELLDALQGLPLVRAEIKTVAEAAMENAQQKGHETGVKTASSASPVEVATGRFPLQAALRKYFMETAQTAEPEAVRHQVDEFAGRVLGFSSGAMARAWALRRLAERYTAAEVARLSLESQRQLESVIRNHVAALRRRVDDSRDWLRPMLESLGDDSRLSVELKPGWPDDWPGFAQAVFIAAQQLDRLTDGLFAGAGAPGQNTNQQARTLLASLQELDAQLERLEARVAGEFLAR